MMRACTSTKYRYVLRDVPAGTSVKRFNNGIPGDISTVGRTTEKTQNHPESHTPHLSSSAMPGLNTIYERLFVEHKTTSGCGSLRPASGSRQDTSSDTQIDLHAFIPGDTTLRKSCPRGHLYGMGDIFKKRKKKWSPG